MRFGSVCSGVEAASVAWEPLGMTPAWHAEVDPYCTAVLAHRWPGVPNLGDITRPDFVQEAQQHGSIDLLVGGTPCQAFSLAGKRGGFSDPRGRLTLAYIGLAERLRPRWFVWENVPGVLSSGGGRDFGAFLGGMAELGYGLCYRVLDALYFGVPQRRRRVFVVGHLGGRPPEPVLFEQGFGGDDTPKHREVREEAPGPCVCDSCRYGREPVTVSFRGREHGTQMELGGPFANALKANDGRGLSKPHVWWRGRIRRLTLVEQERLQGFPDHHTLVPWPGGKTDTHRERVIGNSMAVPVMAWIGKRLLAYESST